MNKIISSNTNKYFIIINKEISRKKEEKDFTLFNAVIFFWVIIIFS